LAKKKKIKKRKLNIDVYRVRSLSITVICLAVMLGLLYFAFYYFTVKTVTVEGNVHYSDEKIREMVLG